MSQSIYCVLVLVSKWPLEGVAVKSKYTTIFEQGKVFVVLRRPVETDETSVVTYSVTWTHCFLSRQIEEHVPMWEDHRHITENK